LSESIVKSNDSELISHFKKLKDRLKKENNFTIRNLNEYANDVGKRNEKMKSRQTNFSKSQPRVEIADIVEKNETKNLVALSQPIEATLIQNATVATPVNQISVSKLEDLSAQIKYADLKTKAVNELNSTTIKVTNQLKQAIHSFYKVVIIYLIVFV